MVKSELGELFGAEDMKAFNTYTNKAQRDLWWDTYWAHLEFVKAVKDCYR